MHPCPIGRGLSLLSNLFDLDCLYYDLDIPEEGAWDLEAGVIRSALAEFIWERVEIIGSGTVQPTIGKAFRGVKRDTLLTLELRGGRRSAWGLKAIPGEQGTPFLPSPELRTMS